MVLTPGSRKSLDVTLKEDVKALDEVVVVGYGSQLKRSVTGAISSVKSEELEAPNAVSLFVSTAESGGYNGLTAGLYEQKSVFTLDAPEIDGTYKAELHKNLWPFKGALCMTDGGDIVFINTVQYTDEDKEYLSAEEGEMPEVRHAFYEHGGVPNYAGQYAVFGQVFEGVDVLEKIADSEMGTEIVVKSVEILTEK